MEDVRSGDGYGHLETTQNSAKCCIFVVEWTKLECWQLTYQFPTWWSSDLGQLQLHLQGLTYNRRERSHPAFWVATLEVIIQSMFVVDTCILSSIYRTWRPITLKASQTTYSTAVSIGPGHKHAAMTISTWWNGNWADFYTSFVPHLFWRT